MERYESAWADITDDMGIPKRAREGQVEQNSVARVLFEAKDIVLGGLDKLRQNPFGSIEVGSAIAATGILAGAIIVPRLRHSH